MRDRLRDILSNGIDPVALVRGIKNLAREKFDHFVPEELAAEDYAARRLDAEGTLRVIEEILGA